MTESFSPNSFVSVGPNADWSKVVSTSNSKETKNVPAWSSSWDTPVVSPSKPSLGFKTNWETSIVPNKQQPQAQTQQQQPKSIWTNNWEVAIDQTKSPNKQIHHHQIAPQTTQAQNPQTPFTSPSSTTTTPPTSSPSSTTTTTAADVLAKTQEQQQHEVTKQSLYKTEVCRSWVEKGTCKYGHKCQFAHGEDELRVIMRHPKYKTELCKTFVATGSCPYGNRCRFIHPPTVGDHTNNSHQIPMAFSPATSSGSITPPHSSVDETTNALDVSQLLQSLPQLTTLPISNDIVDKLTTTTTDDDTLSLEDDHRLSFFKHLTDE